MNSNVDNKFKLLLIFTRECYKLFHFNEFVN